MTKDDWIKAFACHMAECLTEPVREFHYGIAEYWADEMDVMTPEEAVKEEFSYWGG